ncbi:MAG TPA: heme-binding domain-containing protein [Saprospiraceae bacterium]|jgi:hypothetical protein|nr:heme-binding domain-containing protein [Saprospiraceae bacterium]HRO09394.1 heme-binding domain-containing protein [Saprospiraceae bacterium]HRP41593.1 heme-binding domain-containing protein [Saprospiraceae bacterium]
MKQKNFKKIVVALVTILIIIQFIGVEKNTSTVSSENAIDKHYSIPANVQTLLKTSCYDCHSNNTVYPWYNNIQPVKWWVGKHINDGKKELNFDEFNTYTEKKKLHKLDEVIETIKDNEMPLKSYTIIHNDAKLSPTDKVAIEKWVNDLKNQISAGH